MACLGDYAGYSVLLRPYVEYLDVLCCIATTYLDTVGTPLSSVTCVQSIRRRH